MNPRVHRLQTTWKHGHLVPRPWSVQDGMVGASIHPSGQPTDHQPSCFRPFLGHATCALRGQLGALPCAHHRQTLRPLSRTGPPSPAKQHRRWVGDVPQQRRILRIVPTHGLHPVLVCVVHPTRCLFPGLCASPRVLVPTSHPGLCHATILFCGDQGTTRSPTGQRQKRQPPLCLILHPKRKEVKHHRPCRHRIHPWACFFCTRRSESKVCVVIWLYAISLLRSILLSLPPVFRLF